VRRERLLRELLDRIERIPDVRAASYSHLGVFTGGNSAATIDVEGYTPRGDHDRGSALDVVGPGYFSTLGVPVLLGREILESDRGDAPAACVINEAFASLFFDGRNPIGRRITARDDGDTQATCQIVGVAGNARTQRLRGDVEPRFFVSRRAASSTSSPTLFVRTATDTGPVVAAVRKAIQGVDAGLPIMSVRWVREQMAPLTAQDRTTAQLAVAFGCVALALAAIGLYGVVAFGIARRTGEIAIRLALGARSGRIVSMILGETAGLVGVGLALGGGLAYAASRLVESRLYGVAPQDPLTLLLALGLLLLAAFGAAYLPARRASRLDPIVALRQ
jgi:predicted permease